MKHDSSARPSCLQQEAAWGWLGPKQSAMAPSPELDPSLLAAWLLGGPDSSPGGCHGDVHHLPTSHSPGEVCGAAPHPHPPAPASLAGLGATPSMAAAAVLAEGPTYTHSVPTPTPAPLCPAGTTHLTPSSLPPTTSLQQASASASAARKCAGPPLATAPPHAPPRPASVPVNLTSLTAPPAPPPPHRPPSPSVWAGGPHSTPADQAGGESSSWQTGSRPPTPPLRAPSPSPPGAGSLQAWSRQQQGQAQQQGQGQGHRGIHTARKSGTPPVHASRQVLAVPAGLRQLERSRAGVGLGVERQYDISDVQSSIRRLVAQAERLAAAQARAAKVQARMMELVEGREEADAQTAKLAAAQHEVYATRQRRQAASRRLARLDEARAVDSEKLTAHLEALRGARTALKLPPCPTGILQAAMLRREEAIRALQGPSGQGAWTALRTHVGELAALRVAQLAALYQLGPRGAPLDPPGADAVAKLREARDREDLQACSHGAPRETAPLQLPAAQSPAARTAAPSLLPPQQTQLNHVTHLSRQQQGAAHGAGGPDWARPHDLDWAEQPAERGAATGRSGALQGAGRVGGGGLLPTPQLLVLGLELPEDLARRSLEGAVGWSGSFDEEQRVAAALGYVAHLVDALAVYLDIPLRYALRPRLSTSLILDFTPQPPSPPTQEGLLQRGWNKLLGVGLGPAKPGLASELASSAAAAYWLLGPTPTSALLPPTYPPPGASSSSSSSSSSCAPLPLQPTASLVLGSTPSPASLVALSSSPSSWLGLSMELGEAGRRGPLDGSPSQLPLPPPSELGQGRDTDVGVGGAGQWGGGGGGGRGQVGLQGPPRGRVGVGGRVGPASLHCKAQELPLYCSRQDCTRFAYAIYLLNKDVEQVMQAIPGTARPDLTAPPPAPAQVHISPSSPLASL
ncbi:hypothetical protein V8C86DRAFT_3024167 [Haematococcus lacustris]